MKTFALIVGIALVIVGIFIGLTPTGAALGRSGSFPCGSVFMSKISEAEQEDSDNEVRGYRTHVTALCKEKLSNRSIPAWGLIVVGLAVAGGSFAIPSRPAAK